MLIRPVTLQNSTMAPPAAILPDTVNADPYLINSIKKNAIAVGTTQYDVCEDYEGNYRFAPIEEAQVSRAMIKRLELSNHHRMKSIHLHVTYSHIATST